MAWPLIISSAKDTGQTRTGWEHSGFWTGLHLQVTYSIIIFHSGPRCRLRVAAPPAHSSKQSLPWRRWWPLLCMAGGPSRLAVAHQRLLAPKDR